MRQTLLERENRQLRVGNTGLEDTVESLRAENAHESALINNVTLLSLYSFPPEDDIVNLKDTVRKLRDELATSNQEKERLNERNKRSSTFSLPLRILLC